MKAKPFIISFYISAAALAVTAILDFLGFPIGVFVISILVFVHFGSQAMNLFANNQISRNRLVSVLIGIALALFLRINYLLIDILFLIQFYLILLVFIRGYLFNTAIYPNALRVLIYPIVGAIVFSVLFRIMHWPWSDTLYLVGYGSLAILLVHVGIYKANTPVKVHLEDEVDQIGVE